jgi:hypothetical protein
MDIKDLDTRSKAEAGAEMQVFNPLTGKMSDFHITIKGIDSDEYRSQSANLREQLMTSKMLKQDFDREACEIETFVAITIGWRGLEDGGKEVKFTEKRCRQLYKSAPYVRDQLDRFIANRANFTKG